MMKEIMKELEKEIAQWKDTVKKLSYYKIKESKNEDEAKKLYNEAKKTLTLSRNILKHLPELRDLKIRISQPPWDKKYYEFKDNSGVIRFYFYFNPLNPKSESPTRSLQINLEFWEDGTLKVFFKPSNKREIIKELANKFGLTEEEVKGLIEQFLEKDNYKEVIRKYQFTDSEGKEVEDMHDWIGKIFNVESVSPDDIIFALRGARELFDIYRKAIQEVMSVYKFRGEG